MRSANNRRVPVSIDIIETQMRKMQKDWRCYAFLLHPNEVHVIRDSVSSVRFGWHNEDEASSREHIGNFK